MVVKNELEKYIKSIISENIKMSKDLISSALELYVTKKRLNQAQQEIVELKKLLN